MKNLFMCILANLTNYGNITSASMYDDELSMINIKTNSGLYSVSITKKKEAVRNENR